MEGVLIDWSLEQPVDIPGLPVELLSREQVAAELVRRERRKAMDAAYEAELILRMAELSPDDGDPKPGAPGCPPGFPSRLLPDDPGDLLHIKCLVIGSFPFSGPHHCGASASVAARREKVHWAQFASRDARKIDFVRPET